jgi:hypothetical protein
MYVGQGARIPTWYVVYSVLFYQLNIYFNIDADYFPFKVPGFWLLTYSVLSPEFRYLVISDCENYGGDERRGTWK